MTNFKPPIHNKSPHLPFGDKQDSPFYGKDIISVNQFDREQLAYIFDVAHEMYEMVARVGSFDLLKGKILANLYSMSPPPAPRRPSPPPWSAWAAA
jgi:aspartate carbamoyltransferase catalytic subunit